MLKLTSMGLCIGLNGWSVRDEEYFEMVRAIPDDRILFGTDAPFCDIRPSHPGFKFLDSERLPTARKPEKFVAGEMVKSRNEPCNIGQIATVVAGVRNTDTERLSEVVRSNTFRLFKKMGV